MRSDDFKSESLGGWDIGLLVKFVYEIADRLDEVDARLSALEADFNGVQEVRELSVIPAFVPANRRRNW